jgi:hypothetical protein
VVPVGEGEGGGGGGGARMTPPAGRLPVLLEGKAAPMAIRGENLKLIIGVRA